MTPPQGRVILPRLDEEQAIVAAIANMHWSWSTACAVAPASVVRVRSSFSSAKGGLDFAAALDTQNPS